MYLQAKLIDESMQAIRPDQMRKIEEAAESLGVSRLLLMENAGASVARHVRARFGRLQRPKVLVVAGTGNNGGDGFVAARHLTGCGIKVTVFLLGDSHDIKTIEALYNWQIIGRMTSSISIHKASKSHEVTQSRHLFEEADIIIDAIFGTGVKGDIREPHSSAMDLINTSKAYKIAVDIPSGLDPLTGQIRNKVVKADTTISFHKVKQGLLKKNRITGKVIVAPIGVPYEAGSGLL